MNKLILIPALALSAALVGCDRPDDGQIVGQRSDTTTRSESPTTTPPPVTAPSPTTPPADSTVAAKAADAVSDATITTEVKAALAADPQLSALRIDVDTSNGVVTLKGPAPDEKARSRATQLAAAPKGVTRVENQLTLK